jgi:hypothetical protein
MLMAHQASIFGNIMAHDEPDPGRAGREDLGDGPSRPRFEVTISFEDHGGQTRVGWRRVFDTGADCQRVAAFAVEATEQNLDGVTREVADLA